MKCPKCSYENRSISQFCGKCGTSLGSVDKSSEPNPASKTGDWFCDVCGINNKSSTTFCGACKTTQGTKLSNSVLNRLFDFWPEGRTYMSGYKTSFDRKAYSYGCMLSIGTVILLPTIFIILFIFFY